MGETFYDRFQANMREVGLPAPAGLFATTTTALATIGALTKAITQYGPNVTLSELVFTMPLSLALVPIAGALGEVVVLGGALTAAFYVGMCIGALLRATGQSVTWANLAAVTMDARMGTPAWLHPVLVGVFHREAVRR